MKKAGVAGVCIEDKLFPKHNSFLSNSGSDLEDPYIHAEKIKAIKDETTDSLVDVGCDHGLLSIYLVTEKLAKNVIASDINQSALNMAIKNISKYKLDIPTILSDGLENIDVKNINTLVISGMGTSTIIHILDNKDKITNITKIIIQSNNNHEELRTHLNEIGYYLEDETYTLDNKKWYITCKFIKSTKKNNPNTLKYGLLNNEDYNEYLLNHYKSIYKHIPITSIVSKTSYYKKITNLKKAISENKKK